MIKINFLQSHLRDKVFILRGNSKNCCHLHRDCHQFLTLTVHNVLFLINENATCKQSIIYKI